MAGRIELLNRMLMRRSALYRHLNGMRKSKERMILLGVIGRLTIKIREQIANLAYAD